MPAMSKDTIRNNARGFSSTFAGTKRENAESQTFWIRFFEIFGRRREEVALFEEVAVRTSTANRGRVDVLVTGQMAIEHKSAGQNLETAMDQLIDYLPSLRRCPDRC